MSNSSWANAKQAETKPLAQRHGETWTSAELEFVSEFRDELNVELAKAMGRTLFAIQSVKQAVKAGKQARVAASDRPYRGFMIGDDEGWD